MNMNWKNKIELTFTGFGILMVIIVVLFAVQSFGFLLGNISAALDKKTDGIQAPIRFHVERAAAVIKK